MGGAAAISGRAHGRSRGHLWPMGGAAAISGPRSTGTVVAAVASVPSPSSRAAAVLARQLLAPMVASEEAAAAAGWARRLLVEVVYSSLATRWRP